MPFGIDDVATGLNILAPITGMGIAELTHGQQLRHQKDFQDQQIAGQHQMALNNEAISYDMWKKTNYSAQVDELEKAGLNPGLLYAKGGPGGTTAISGSNSVAGGNAPNASANMGMALQQASQLRLLNAQADNLEADTANKRSAAEVNKANLPKIAADITNTQTDTELKESQIELTKFNARIQNIAAEIAETGKSLQLGLS